MVKFHSKIYVCVVFYLFPKKKDVVVGCLFLLHTALFFQAKSDVFSHCSVCRLSFGWRCVVPLCSVLARGSKGGS